MKLIVDEAAVRWMKQEMNVKQGETMRIYVKLGGHASLQPGYSLGISRDVPQNPGLLQEADGVTFFMEADQLWYLDGKDLHVKADPGSDSIYLDAV